MYHQQGSPKDSNRPDTNRMAGTISNTRVLNNSNGSIKSGELSNFPRKKTYSNSPYINNAITKSVNNHRARYEHIYSEQNFNDTHPREELMRNMTPNNKNTQHKPPREHISRLDELLSRNDIIYKNLQERLEEISRSNKNIDANISNIKPYSDSHRTEYYERNGEEDRERVSGRFSKMREDGDQQSRMKVRNNDSSSLKVQEQGEADYQINMFGNPSNQKFEPHLHHMRKQEGKIVDTRLTKINSVNNGSPTKNTERYGEETQRAKLEQYRNQNRRQEQQQNQKQKSFANMIEREGSQTKYRQYSQGYEVTRNYREMDSSPIGSQYHLLSQDKQAQARSSQKNNHNNTTYLQNSANSDKKIKALSSKYFQSKQLHPFRHQETKREQYTLNPNQQEKEISIHPLSPRHKKHQGLIDNEHPYLYVAPPQIPQLPINDTNKNNSFFQNNHRNHDQTFQEQNTIELNSASIHKDHCQGPNFSNNYQNPNDSLNIQPLQEQQQCSQCLQDQMNKDQHFHNISNFYQKSRNILEEKKEKQSYMFIPFNKLYSSPIMELVSNSEVVVSRKYKTSSKTISINSGGRNNAKIINGIKYRYRGRNGANNLLLEETRVYQTFKDMLNIGESVGVGIVGGSNCLKKKLHVGLIAHTYNHILELTHKHTHQQRQQRQQQEQQPYNLHIVVEHQQAATHATPLHHSYSSQLSSQDNIENEIILANVQALLEKIFTGMREKLVGEDPSHPHRIRVTKMQLLRVQPPSQTDKLASMQHREKTLKNSYQKLCDIKLVSTNKVDAEFIDSIQLDHVVWCANPLFKYHDQALAILAAERSYRNLVSMKQQPHHNQNTFERHHQTSSSVFKASNKIDRSFLKKSIRNKSPISKHKLSYINSFSEQQEHGNSSTNSKSPGRETFPRNTHIQSHS